MRQSWAARRSGLYGFLDDHALERLEIRYQRIFVDHFNAAQDWRALRPAVRGIEIEHVPVDSNELRESLCQYTEIPCFDFAGT